MVGVLNGLRALELAGTGPIQRTNLLDGFVCLERSGDRDWITQREKRAVLGSCVLARVGPHVLDDRERVFGRQQIAAVDESNLVPGNDSVIARAYWGTDDDHR